MKRIIRKKKIALVHLFKAFVVDWALMLISNDFYTFYLKLLKQVLFFASTKGCNQGKHTELLNSKEYIVWIVHLKLFGSSQFVTLAENWLHFLFFSKTQHLPLFLQHFFFFFVDSRFTFV